MKKVFLTGILISVVVFAAFSQVGIIRELTGEVELKPAGSSTFVPASLGAEVAPDTVVSTGFRSTAIIVIGSNTITVRPLTRLSLAEISSSAGVENLNVNLQAGRVRVEVKPPAGTRANTTVQSPSATASVRGTVLDMDVQNMSVVEGSVGWQSTNGLTTVVPAGFSGGVTSDGGVSNTNTDVSSSSLMPSMPLGAGQSGEQIGAALVTDGDIEVILDWGQNQ